MKYLILTPESSSNSDATQDKSSSRFATFAKTPAGVIAEGFCDYGDNLIESSSGKPTMKCRDDGEWVISGFKNSCVRQKCPAIYITQDPTDKTKDKNPTGYEDNENNKNILLQGSNIDGSYNNGYQPENYGYAIWSTSYVGEKVSATKCIAGYEMVKKSENSDETLPPTMTCGQYGKWNFDSLKNSCKRIVCEASTSSYRNYFRKTNASTSLQRSIKEETFDVADECADESYDMPTAGKPTAYCNYKGQWEFENLCTKSCENIGEEGKRRDYWDDNVNHEQSPNTDSLTTSLMASLQQQNTLCL